MPAFYPAFCQPFEQCPSLLEGCLGIRLRFNPALFEETDFARCGIEAVCGKEKRQSEYLAGRLCARQALQQLTGEAFVPARDQDGRALWPQGISGSISHSHGHAAALVGFSERWQGLGLDLEHCLSPERALRLAPSLLTASEQAHLAALKSAEEQAFYVTLVFSLKESLFKALYPLCLTRFYFQDAQMIEYGQGQAQLRLLCDLPGFARGTVLDGHFLLHDKMVLTQLAIPAKQA